jgi:Domain of unknown function (DUF222)
LVAVLAEVNAVDVAALADQQVRDEVHDLLVARNMLDAAIGARLGSFDVRELSDLDGLHSTRTWLTAFGRLSQGAASGWLNRARLLRHLPALAAAAAEGAVSSEHVDKVHQLAYRVGVAAVTDHDDVLAAVSSSANPAETQKAAERIAAHLDPDGAPPDPQADFDRRELTLARTGSMTYVRGRLDPEAAAVVQTVLDALMRPPAAHDARTAAQRRVDALVDLFKGVLCGGALPTVGGERPQIGVLVSPLTLAGLTPTTPTPTADDTQAGTRPTRPTSPTPTDPLAGTGAAPEPDRAWLSWVGQIPTELAQRLSCDCVTWRIVLDPATGLPLDLGRTHRIVPAWLRRAVLARDRQCRWPGCDCPAQWLDIHHLDAWAQGGQTNVDRLLSLCRYHHMKVHEGHWTVEFNNATGQVRVTRPDGTPYELGPSQPWTTATRQGPTIPRPRQKPDTEATAADDAGPPT